MDTRFGEFRFDTATRQLFRADLELPLSPKAFELLKLLIESRPHRHARQAKHRVGWWQERRAPRSTRTRPSLVAIPMHPSGWTCLAYRGNARASSSQASA